MKGSFAPLLLSLSLLTLPLSALAGQCEDNFSKEGNILKGTIFKTKLTVPGLGVSSAISQLHNIVVSENLNVLDENAEAGSMLFEDPPNARHRGLQVHATATSDGTVSLLMKTRPGSMAGADSIKSTLCKWLYQLKPGKGKVAAVAAKVVPITSAKLLAQVEEQVKQNVAMVDASNKGKTLRVTGYFLASNTEDGLSVIYDPNPSLFPGFIRGERRLLDIRIFCRMAPDQRGFALTLRPGDKMDLTGTYRSYESAVEGIFWMDNCRQSK